MGVCLYRRRRRQIYSTVLVLKVTEGFGIGSGRAVEDKIFSFHKEETSVSPHSALCGLLVLASGGAME